MNMSRFFKIKYCLYFLIFSLSSLVHAVTVQNVYDYLHTQYPEYDNVSYGPPTQNILRKNDWLIQTPDIWGYNLNDYKAVMCDVNGLRSQSFLTKCDSCFNIPQCETKADCNAPAGFPVECRVPNFLKSGGVQGCPGNTSTMQNQKMCMTPAQDLLEQFYSEIVSAQSSVDIATYNAGNDMLTEQTFDESGKPNGIPDPFFFVVKKAFDDVVSKDPHKRLRVRLVGGTETTGTSLKSAETFLYGMTSDLPKPNNFEMVVVPFLSCPAVLRKCGNLYQSTSLMFNASINHAKNLVVDKLKLITGGENFWGLDYMASNMSTIQNESGPTTPVNDAMIKIEGPVAQGATNYENVLFGYLNWIGPSLYALGKDICYSYTSNKISEENPCGKNWIINTTPVVVTPKSSTKDLSVTATYVAQLNSLNNAKINSVEMGDNADQSEPARAYAISNATKNVKIFQQSLFVPDLPPVGNYTLLFPAEPGASLYGPNPNVTIDAIATVFQKNIQNPTRAKVPVYILVSSFLKGGIYSSFAPISHTYSFMCKTLMARGIQMDEAITELNQNLKVAFFSYNQEITTGMKPAPANHNKFWMVDDHLFYFGAHNFYPQAVQEFGVIIDSKEAATQLNAEYWNRAWENADKSGSKFSISEGKQYCTDYWA